MFAVTGKYGRPSSFASAAALEHDRHRLLGADDRDRDDRHAGAHRDLDEAAAAEAAELVALGEALAGALRALGEHEHELAFVVQQAVRVVGVRGDAAAARPQRADDRQRAEQVLGEAVDRAAELAVSMPCMIAGASGGIAPAWLATSSAPPCRGQVVEVLPLDAEPVLVDRVVEPPGELARHARCGPTRRRRSGGCRRRGRRRATRRGTGRDRRCGRAPRPRRPGRGPGRVASATSGRSGTVGHPRSQPESAPRRSKPDDDVRVVSPSVFNEW